MIEVSPLAPADILAQRLSNQHLARPHLSHPAELVAHLGAVQAQDYPAALWAIGLRLEQVPAAAVEDAFNRGAILRTHVLRPTWHFVAPADLRWLLALTAPRIRATLASRDRALGLDAALVARSQALLASALHGGQQLTRAELDTLLRQSVVPHGDGQVVGHLLLRAELDGLLCSGPRRGKQFTYALLEERVPPVAPLDREEALAELVRRYVTSHGPATLQDLAWWSSLSLAELRRGLELNAGGLRSAVVDGLTYWFSQTATAARCLPEAAYLLPNFDEYTVAYRQRQLFSSSDAGHSREDVPFANVVVLAGRVVGSWKRSAGAAGVGIRVRWFRPPSAEARDALAAAVARYAAFLGYPVALVD